MISTQKVWFFILTMLSIHCTVFALPLNDSLASDFNIQDAEDHKLTLSDLKGKSLVIFYETRDENVIEENRSLKSEILKRIQESSKDSIQKDIVILPIIDCSSAFSPFRGMWKNKIRENSIKEKVNIYCDWTGEFRVKYQTKPDQSNVIVIDRNGKIIFARTGKIPLDQFPFDKIFNR